MKQPRLVILVIGLASTGQTSKVIISSFILGKTDLTLEGAQTRSQKEPQLGKVVPDHQYNTSRTGDAEDKPVCCVHPRVYPGNIGYPPAICYLDRTPLKIRSLIKKKICMLSMILRDALTNRMWPKWGCVSSEPRL